jgi:alpha-mannosidase
MESNLNAEKVRKITIERVEKFLSKTAWTDINLTSKIYGPANSSSVSLKVWSVPDTDPNFTDKVSYAQMKQEPESSFSAAKVGQTFGPEWSTHWVKVDISLPAEFEGHELHFIWDSTGEALLYQNGQPHQAFNGSTGDDRRDFHILTKNARPGDRWSFEIEMVSCGMFGNANGEFLAPPNGTKVFTLKKAQVQCFNRVVYNLWTDLKLLLEIAQSLPNDDVRGWQAVECMRNIVNVCHTDNEFTWAAAAAIAAKFFSQKNGGGQHEVMATGHCHIDTAWLWPYSETRRKVARSWATQCTIMDAFPEHIFTASQAQQYEWMKDLYPQLFARIQEKAKKGQFVPIGGTWIEMDCNIPSGESFARQFLFGQKFFQRNFGGMTCKVFWLPDTFGYSSQLPQIIKQSECDFFLTQKLSWNNINKFPHNTFYWQGLDGTQVLSHFPPADTYVSEANVKDLVQGTKNFKTKDKSNRSMMLFGWGDGGGGPDPHHLARLSRLGDVAGVPKVKIGHPEAYFRAVVAEEAEKLKNLYEAAPALSGLASSANATDIPKWVGELYFELHRGTYTTHARNKLGNRRCEFLLQSLELLTVLASTRSSVPASKIDEIQKSTEDLWKLLLLNQFHDVLPGTSIGLVYRDSDKHYKQIQDTVQSYSQELLASITGGADKGLGVFNSLGWARTGLVEFEMPASGLQQSDKWQESHNGTVLAVADAPGMGTSDLSFSGPARPVGLGEGLCISTHPMGFFMENAHIRASFDAHGRLWSLFHKTLEREAIAPGLCGNHFVLFEDVPFFWDAWDVELYHTEKPVKLLGYEMAGTAKIIENGPVRVGLEFSLAISPRSRVSQRIFLDSTSDVLTYETNVTWHESRKFLKVEFPLNVHSNQVWYSTQFGCQARPNHKNTTWDLAKFEVCAHHWADLNEFGFGVALLNDCKYGYSCEENVLRLSLLRSSKQPDDTADMGEQSFKYGLLAHAGSHADAQLPMRGLEFNVPLKVFGTPEKVASQEAQPSKPEAPVFQDEQDEHDEHGFRVAPSTPITHIILSSAVSSTLSLEKPKQLISLFSARTASSTLVLETAKFPEYDAGILGSAVGSAGAHRGWVVIRLWESSGGRGTASFTSSLPITQITHVNILENAIQRSTKRIILKQGEFSVGYQPFEVITLACKFAEHPR